VQKREGSIFSKVCSAVVDFKGMQEAKIRHQRVAIFGDYVYNSNI
jgi:hypothetical protein